MSLIIKYPLDLSGQNPTNRVINEYHELPDEEVNRIFCLDYGPFYTAGLVVTELQTQRVLTLNVDYVPMHVIPQPTMRSGLEVCAAIAIINTSVTTEVTVTAHMVGGEYTRLTEVIIRLLDELSLDAGPIQYGDLIGLPSEFLPSGHIHDLGDLYGFEYMVDALYKVRDAILVGNQHYLENLEARFTNVIDQMRTDFGTAFDTFQQHVDDENNPHETDKVKAGLEFLMNYPVANTAEIAAGNAPNRYLTVQPLMQWIFSNLKTPLETHVDATGNVHGMVPSDINLGNLPNFPAATPADMVNPLLSSNKLVTPEGIATLLNLLGFGTRVQLTSANNLDSIDRAGRFWYHSSSKPVNALPSAATTGIVFIEMEAISDGAGVLTAKVMHGIELDTGLRWWRRTTQIGSVWTYNDWDPQ